MIIIKFPLSLFSTLLCRSGIIEWSTKAVLWGEREREMLKRQYCKDGYCIYHIDTRTNSCSETMAGCWWNLTEYKLRDTGVPSEKSSLGKKETKTKRPISLPHPQFQTARQVTGFPCWNTLECLLHGGLPASSSSAQWISLKTTSEGFFRRAGQAWIWNSKWNVFFSILAASPLSLSLKNMNREILSLLFLLYNKRDLQYGRPPWQHRCCFCCCCC